jgi:hypothetical protein
VLAAAVHSHVDIGLLRAGNQAFRLVKTLLAERFRLFGK